MSIIFMNIRYRTKEYVAIALLSCISYCAVADVALAPLFQDNAVLQREKPVPVWGTAEPGEKITVEFAGQKKETHANPSGYWCVTLESLTASAQAAQLIVSGKNTLKLKNILVGEVWICSGQSNMEFPVRQAKDANKEIASADNPLIRHFKVERAISEFPIGEVKSVWLECNNATVGEFSAVAYYFAKEISQKLDVPVGLINATLGGTPIESFISRTALESNPDIAIVMDRWKQVLAKYPTLKKAYDDERSRWVADRESAMKSNQIFTKRAPRKPVAPGSHYTPSGVFNAMVHPLIPYAIRGFLWYQGEANASRFNEYPALFSIMINQWRKDFGQGELPFYFVQLANLEKKSDKSNQQWAFQREAQATALKLPNTAMAVSVDVGEQDNIHPKNKQEVGHRLAIIALSLAYRKDIEYSGPIFQSARIDGNSFRLGFTHSEGLRLNNTDASAFRISGADKVFHNATARIDGKEVVITSPEVEVPVAVRYAWDNNPAVSIYNGVGLPAPPFRTDDWPAPNLTLQVTTISEKDN